MEKSVIWKKHFEEWKRSGLSQDAFCQEKALSLHTFKYWRCKLLSKTTEISSVKIVQISPQPQTASTTAFLLRYGKWEIGVSPHFDEGALNRLLSVFERR